MKTAGSFVVDKKTFRKVVNGTIKKLEIPMIINLKKTELVRIEYNDSFVGLMQCFYVKASDFKIHQNRFGNAKPLYYLIIK